MIATIPAARQVAQEDEEDRDDQAHSHEQVVNDVMCRHVDQLGSLVEDFDLHPRRRQQVSFLDFQDLRFHRVGHRLGLFVFAHHDDALDHIVVNVAFLLPFPRIPGAADALRPPWQRD